MWTIANIISVLRALMAAPLAFYLLDENKMGGVIVIALVVVSDVADGWIARRRNEVSEAGKFIDPIADKIVAATGVACLTLGGQIPAWFFWAVVGRDAVILIFGSIATRKTGFILPSNYAGKAAVVLLACTMTLHFVVEPSAFHAPALWITSAVMAYSLYSYGARFAAYIRRPAQQ